MNGLLTAEGYRVTKQADGTMVVHDVPIFCTCTRTAKDGTDVHFDDQWIAAAYAWHMREQRESYLPPLHIQHHDPEKESQPRRAGLFKVTRTGPITYEGVRRTAIFADLILTDEWAQKDVQQNKLPYRSVELKIADPHFQSLALLDTEAPYLRLPLLMVNEVSKEPGAQFSMDWRTDDGPVCGSFLRGDDARLLFHAEGIPMTDTEEVKEQAEMFGDGGDSPPPKKKKGDEDTQDMQDGGGIDVKSIIKAIESGEIAVQDMDAILAAIQKYEQSKGGEDQQPMQPAAPAAVPGGESMKADTDLAVQFAALRGELDGIKAERAEDKAVQKRKDDVARALERLRDRPCGADIETKLTKFHEECGGKEEVFNAYVDALTNTVAPRKPGGAPIEASFSAELPDFVMKYAQDGGDAPDRAAAAWQRWREQHDTGATRMSAERYVELAMKRSSRVFSARRN